MLLGGEPGIGKSTLVLQVALGMKGVPVLYVSGEESEQQIKMRADRLKLRNDRFYVLTETQLENIFQQVAETDPGLLVIDSVQTIFTDKIESSPGSVSQIRECTAELLRFSKQSGVPVFLIGHITKDGTIAGPKILEHMVDTVLQFEGDRHHLYRILRSVKNRFGSTAELGIYEMQSSGLREVSNPSEVLIAQREELLSGVAIAATMEAFAPCSSRRRHWSARRCTARPSVLRRDSIFVVQHVAGRTEKRCGFRLGAKDVFLNLAGGIRVEDPAIDLAVICAILSSNEDIAITPKICFAAEVGLSGDPAGGSRRTTIGEAEKLGFEQIIISKYNKRARPLLLQRHPHSCRIESGRGLFAALRLNQRCAITTGRFHTFLRTRPTPVQAGRP